MGARWLGLLVVAVVGAGSGASASTLSLQSTGDSWIRRDSPNSNAGSELFLQVTSVAHLRRTLVQFNVSAIRSCASVSSATLRLRVGANTGPAGGASRVHAVHRVTAPWHEMQVTWNRRITGVDWTTGGGDFAPATSTAVVPAGLGAYVDFDVTADVAGFVRGTAVNFGWVVKDEAEKTEPEVTVGYFSRGVIPVADRPVLLVSFDADHAACDDGNTCTADTCDLAAGCLHANVAPATPCATDGNPCTTDACDGAGSCGHAPGNAGTECRTAAGICDAAEQCTGTTAACPPDVRATGVCRSAAGDCDLPESCDGVGAGCPPDGKRVGVCRSAAGGCDVAESCNGSTDDCPADVVATAGSECRGAAGLCDVAEACDGVTGACPQDQKRVGVCRSAADVCDVPESCDGSRDDCPADVVASAGIGCRAAAGPCDVAETCDGVNGVCPLDAFLAGVVCRSTLGACDPAEACSGTGPSCPPDVRSTEVCRPSVGGCDVAETCDGGIDCPADVVAAPGSECRPANGPCDLAETCSGEGTCPPDVVLPSSVVCRSSAGVCDAAEHCDGTAGACPADVVEATGTVCRSATGECDAVEACDGTSGACPADTKRTDVCRSAAGACDPSESCDGIGDACPADAIAPAGAVCRSATSECDTPELCTGDALECPADVFVECGRRASVECHNLHGGRFTQRTVTVTDPYSGTSQLRLLLEGHVCNAVSINGSAIDDPTVHYHSFIASQNPPHVPFPDYRVTNLFGPLVLEIKHATLLMLPAGVAVGTDAPPPTPGVDAYLCYRLEFPAFRNFYVFHEDQFTTPPVNIRIRKPRLLCAAASVDGSPVSNPGAFMICYRHVRKLPAPNDIDVKNVHVRSQLGTVVGVAGKDDLLCLQSTALSPPP